MCVSGGCFGVFFWCEWLTEISVAQAASWGHVSNMSKQYNPDSFRNIDIGIDKAPRYNLSQSLSFVHCNLKIPPMCRNLRLNLSTLHISHVCEDILSMCSLL